jgi:hypothetical protein
VGTSKFTKINLTSFREVEVTGSSEIGFLFIKHHGVTSRKINLHIRRLENPKYRIVITVVEGYRTVGIKMDRNCAFLFYIALIFFCYVKVVPSVITLFFVFFFTVTFSFILSLPFPYGFLANYLSVLSLCSRSILSVTAGLFPLLLRTICLP